MKILVLFTISVVICASLAETDFLSQDFIDEINRKQTAWKAGRNFPENTTREQLYKLNGFLGVHPDPNYKPKLKVHKEIGAIPETFDARTKWPNCESIRRVRNQGSCGSCWAFAAVETMSDRTCIHSSGSVQFIFSPEDLLSCCGSKCGDCGGGWMMPAFDYWISDGLVSGGDLNSDEGCRPYTVDAFNNGDTPSCSRSCRSGYPNSYSSDKRFGSEDYVVPGSIEQIQQEILSNGPIIVNFEVYQDFYNYQSGVYRHTSGSNTGRHVVKLIGWGVENGLPYWLIANSWGSNWGDNGFFKMLRGQNECGIENYPYAALPKL